MKTLQTPDGCAVRFTPDVLDVGPLQTRKQGRIRIHSAPMRLWGTLLLQAEMHCAGDTGAPPLHQAAAELSPSGKMTVRPTARRAQFFQPLANAWQGLQPPRGFIKARPPHMAAWIGAALQEGGADPHGPRLQPALVYQQARPDGSRHALLAAVDAAQTALAAAGLDPAGRLTEPRR